MKTPSVRLLLASALLAGAGCAFATPLTISFDGTAPPGGAHNYDWAGTYLDVSGFILQGQFGDAGAPTNWYASTGVATISPTIPDPTLPSANGTDFGYLFKGGDSTVPAPTATLSDGGAVFSLQSFLGANLGNQPAGTLTLTGHQVGGGTLTQVFNTLGGNQWSPFTLNGWTNLSSVDFVGSQNGVGLDSVVVTPGAATADVPEPGSIGLLLTGLLGFGTARRKPA